MLLPLAQPFFPGIASFDNTRWMGVRPTMPDGMPAMGDSLDHPGLFYSFGHGHVGLNTAAISANCVVAKITGGPSPVPIDGFALDRFSTRRTGKGAAEK